MEWRQQREQQNAGVQSEPRRFCREARQHRHELQHLEWIGAVMRCLGDRIKTQSVGQPDERQGFLKAAGDILTLLRLSADHQAELERYAHDFWSPSTAERGTTQHRM